MLKRLDQYQFSNRLRKLNRFLQIILSILFFVALNYLAMQHYARYDISRGHLYSISPESKAYIETLAQPVSIIVTTPPNSPLQEEQILYRYVSQLLDQYKDAAHRANRDDLLTIEYVDLLKDTQRAESLAQTYGVEQPNAIIVAGPENTRVLSSTDVLVFDNFDPVAFKGEQAFTSAIIEVTALTRPTLYFTIGHGEMRLNDVSPNRGLSKLATELNARNFALGALDISQVDAIPKDADLIVIADPKGPFLATEEEILRSYLLENAGRIIFLLSPGREHGLDNLLFDWGIRADDMLVLEQNPDYIEGAGNYLLRQFAQHEITDPLIRNQTFILSGPLRPVRPDLGAPIDDRLHLTSLLGSSSSSWAEQAYTSSGTPSFDPSTDLPGPITIGTLAERRTASQLAITIPGGRLLVIGSGDLLANHRLTQTLGNGLFTLSALNWMLDRDQTIALPPRPIEQYTITLSRADFKQLALLFLIPSCTVGLLGIGLLWLRKL